MGIVHLILLVCGLALFGGLVFEIGPMAILSSFARLSWRLLIVLCFPFSLVTIFDTLGWRFAFAHDRVSFLPLLRARLAGEAFNATTPTASVGGEGVKAWLLRPHVSYEESLPSVIVAKTTITIAQGLFLLLGIVAAWGALPVNSPLMRAMQWLLALEVAAVGGFVLVQLKGGLAATSRGLAWLGFPLGKEHGQTLGRVNAGLSGFYKSQRRRLLLSIACHFLGWVFSALETYVILHFLDVPVSLTTATVIEAFGTGIRFATFLVPAHLGVLEGGHVAIFLALGLEAATGLSFSLVRRVREAAWIGLGFTVLAERRSLVRGMPTSAPEA
ncbi:MAG: flippase-like domain-containing protein [Candidatus Rokubacteria bacterium]|nr:flippase-like domain-containing protein [Candidatus Rokubacteria bacterium]